MSILSSSAGTQIEGRTVTEIEPMINGRVCIHFEDGFMIVSAATTLED